MKQTAVEWLVYVVQSNIAPNYIPKEIVEQAEEMEKEQELKIKIQCLKESLQFIDANYMVELLNVKIDNMEKELLTFKLK
jgi:predicted HTH domain antitoxin